MKNKEKVTFDLIRPITNKDGNLIELIYSNLKTRAFGFGREVSLEYAVKFFIPLDFNPNHYLFFKDGLFVGRAVLKLPSERTVALFGIAVKPQFQGQGHGLNIAEYALRTAFENPAITKVSGTALRFNIPSQKLLRKLGMQPDGRLNKKIEHQDYDTYTLVFSIDKETFLQKSKPYGNSHPDSKNFDDLVFEDYITTYNTQKPSDHNSIEYKRRDLYIKLQLEDSKKLISLYVGTICLTATELIENAPIFKYLIDEILYPLHSHDNLSNDIAEILPNSNAFWISSHFILNSISFFLLQHFNPTFQQAHKFFVPIFSTIGYASTLYLSDQYNALIEDKLQALNNNSTIEDFGFFEHCFPEIVLTTASAFIFSLPTAISFAPLGFSYSALSVFSAATSSAINCAYTNKKALAPNNDHVSSKVLPYIADAFTAAYLITKFNPSTFYFLPDIALTLKKTSFFLGAVIHVDQLSKALIEFIPDSTFDYIDSLFGLDSNIIDSNGDDL